MSPTRGGPHPPPGPGPPRRAVHAGTRPHPARRRPLDRRRRLELRLVCPGVACVVAGGRITMDEQPPRPLEGPLTAEQAEDLLLIHGFVGRPPPGLKGLP